VAGERSYGLANSDVMSAGLISDNSAEWLDMGKKFSTGSWDEDGGVGLM